MQKAVPPAESRTPQQLPRRDEAQTYQSHQSFQTSKNAGLWLRIEGPNRLASSILLWTYYALWLGIRISFCISSKVYNWDAVWQGKLDVQATQSWIEGGSWLLTTYCNSNLGTWHKRYWRMHKQQIRAGFACLLKMRQKHPKAGYHWWISLRISANLRMLCLAAGFFFTCWVLMKFSNL